MEAFYEPLRTALLIFPLLSFALITPYMFQQYRKYGSISVFRTLIIFSFVYYLMNAYFLVILPLPERASVTTTYREMMQLRPFQFVLDLKNKWVLEFGNPATYLDALVQPVFTQVVFNVFLTLPFGVYMRYYFKKDLKTTVLLTMSLSMFFEISQLTGLFFIYPGPYRLFDVDDLILNTFGGLVGYAVAPFFAAFMPSREDLDEISYAKAAHVGLIKRAFTYSLDYSLVRVMAAFMPIQSNLLAEFIVFVFYFGLLPYLWNGQTLMMRLLKIRIIQADQKPLRLLNNLLRAILIFVFISRSTDVLNAFASFMMLVESRAFAFFYLGLIVLWFAFMAVYTIYVLIKRPSRLFYDRLSKTRLISVFK